MAITILNPRLISSDLSTIDNWTIGTNNAWAPSLAAPDNHGAYGAFFVPDTGNTLYQTGVFTDFGSGKMHKIKVVSNLVTGGGVAQIRFGTVTAGTISASGTYYFTNSAATNATLTFDMIAGSLVTIDSVTMADIDILGSPTTIVPVYNPWWFTASSINVAQTNHEFVYDLYTGATVTGNYISRIRLQAEPDGNNYSYYSPFNVLESYLSFDRRIQNITSGVTNNNHCKYYTVSIGEAYGSSVTGQTLYTGMTSFSGLTFNGVINDQEDYRTWKYTDYNLSADTSLFLTKQPRKGIKVKNTTDRGTLTFMHHVLEGTTIPSAATQFQLVVYPRSGGTITSTYSNPNYTAATPVSTIMHIPAGIWNLNNLPASLFVSGFSGATKINVCNDSGYTIQMLKSDFKPLSEAIYFGIDDKHSQYDTTRIKFKNSLGGFDYYNFNRIKRKTITVEQSTFEKPTTHRYQKGDRGMTTFNVMANYDYTVYTDYLTYEESIWMEELLISTDVEIVNPDGTTSPIIIMKDGIQLKPHRFNNKLVYYDIPYRPATKINTTRL